MDLSLIATMAALFLAVVFMVWAGAQFLPTVSAAIVRDQSGRKILAVGGARPVQKTLVDQLVRLGNLARSILTRWSPALLGEKDPADSRLRIKLECAGYRGQIASPIFLGGLLCSTAVFLAAGLFAATEISAGWGVLSSAVAFFAITAIGIALPFVVLENLIRRRQRALLAHFPDALDLIRICLEAGMGLDAALKRVGQEFRQGCPVLFDEFHVLSFELSAGASRQQAMYRFAQRTGLSEIRAWVTMVLQAERFGTGMADAVRIHSDQLRQTRRMNAEEKAATLSTKLLFPLIFCIFPALLLVLLGPAAITIQHQLSPGVESNP